MWSNYAFHYIIIMWKKFEAQKWQNSNTIIILPNKTKMNRNDKLMKSKLIAIKNVYNQNELQLKINKTKINIAEMREVEKSKQKSLI